MAKSPGRKAEPVKASVIDRIAKMRRDGSTWAQVAETTGLSRTSTGFRLLLEERGFDKYGLKAGQDRSKSKARGWVDTSNAPKPGENRRGGGKVKRAKATRKAKAKPKAKPRRKATAKK